MTAFKRTLSNRSDGFGDADGLETATVDKSSSADAGNGARDDDAFQIRATIKSLCSDTGDSVGDDNISRIMITAEKCIFYNYQTGFVGKSITFPKCAVTDGCDRIGDIDVCKVAAPGERT